MIDLSQDILYEDHDILALNKPAGIIVHPDGRKVEPSVSGWFAEYYPPSQSVGEPVTLVDGRVIERPGIVHRLDKETSGLLLLAKTKEGHRVLKEQFQKRQVEKIYHLFVHGLIKDDHGTINFPIGRSRSNFKKWSAGRGIRGESREALTYFQVIKRALNGSVTFVEAKPKTGRTHQLRVHFKAIHHPVVCDRLYAGRKPCLLEFKRLALHARSLVFKKVSGETVALGAPYLEDFQKALKTMDLEPQVCY